MKCCICGNDIEGYGNNPEPWADSDSKCCDECNYDYVMLARITLSKSKNPEALLNDIVSGRPWNKESIDMILKRNK